MTLYGKRPNRVLFLLTVAAGLLITALLTAATVPAPASQGQANFVSGNQLQRPDFGFRRWIQVGTPLTPNDLNPPEAPFPEFHNVYIHPGDFDHYSSTGKFRDGTMLIKELVSVGSKEAPSGKGYFMGDFIGLEVALKDTKRFKDEPGGWAYYSFGHSYPLLDKASPQATETCNSCHQAQAADDWVFTQYYPVLRAAKAE